jgi:hypothetical protein
MAHVGPKWSHGIAYNDTRHTNVANRRGSWLGVEWGVTKGTQGASSFLKAYLERTSGV